MHSKQWSLLFASLFLLPTAGGMAQDGSREVGPRIRPLDLSVAIDRAVRAEALLVDRSFLRWQFESPVRWTDEGYSYATPEASIALSREEVERHAKALPEERRWLMYCFHLAHEKGHLLQYEVYREEGVRRLPRRVAEAQADLIAGSYLWLRLSYLVTNPERPEEAREQVLARLGMDPKQATRVLTGDAEALRAAVQLMGAAASTGPDGYPTRSERREALARGLLLGMHFSRIPLMGADPETVRKQADLREGEDLMGWSLRVACELTGTPQPLAPGRVAPAPPGGQDEPLARSLRLLLDEAPRAFRGIRRGVGRKGDRYTHYDSTHEPPGSLLTVLHVSADDSHFMAVLESDPVPGVAEDRWEDLGARIEGYLGAGWRVRAVGDGSRPGLATLVYTRPGSRVAVRLLLRPFRNRYEVRLEVGGAGEPRSAVIPAAGCSRARAGANDGHAAATVG